MRPSDYPGTLPHTILGRDRATAMAMRILMQCRTQPIGSISRDLSVVTRPTSPVRCGSGAEPDRPQCARQRHHHDHGHDSLYPGIKLKRSDIFWSPLVSASCFSAGSGSAARRRTRQSPWLPVAPDVTVDRGPREIDAFLPPSSFYQCGKCCMVRRERRDLGPLVLGGPRVATDSFAPPPPQCPQKSWSRGWDPDQDRIKHGHARRYHPDARRSLPSCLQPLPHTRFPGHLDIVLPYQRSLCLVIL